MQFVDVRLDDATNLLVLQTSAYNAEFALALNRHMLKASEDLVNALAHQMVTSRQEYLTEEIANLEAQLEATQEN